MAHNLLLLNTIINAEVKMKLKLRKIYVFISFKVYLRCKMYHITEKLKKYNSFAKIYAILN